MTTAHPHPTTGRWRARVLAALVLAVAGLLVAPVAAQAGLRSQFAALVADSYVWTPSDAEALQPFAGQNYMELDQRKMDLGQQARVDYSVAARGSSPITGSTPICGALVLEVTRYQAYNLYWVTRSGPSAGSQRAILYRGGLVADGGRPFVGVFFSSSRQLVIRTYNRTPDRTDDRGQFFRGTVYNTWTAAATGTAPSSSVYLSENGVWARTGTKTTTPWITGASGRC